VSFGVSLILFIQSHSPEAPIEFISADRIASGSALIMIDIGGGVEHPGVYELPHGSRVEDAIQSAGGLSDDADEAGIGKAVNRARVLTDGEKIFIPEKDMVKGVKTENQKSSGIQKNSFVSVNTASLTELDTLPGIGEATARKIIDGRPYVALEDLVTRKVVSMSVFEKIKEMISL
jgi:competence protein ComEA